MTSDRVITWVIGGGGLLGRALMRHAGPTFTPGPVPWHDSELAGTVLHDQARAFEDFLGGRPWRVIWAAGAATTSTPREDAMAELTPLEGLLLGLRSALPSGPGTFVLASSAGGVYAGAQEPPFSVTTPPAPLSSYGELKLAQEQLTAELLAPLLPVVIARISNLYGPGQNLDKLQGLISHLARASVTRQPVTIFVPLETTRDYVYVDDAALALLGLGASRAAEQASVRIEIVASGRGTTIGQLIRTMTEITKRRVPVASGTHSSAAAQAIDLRLIPSTPLPTLTPLPAGMHAVYRDILQRTQEQSILAGMSMTR